MGGAEPSAPRPDHVQSLVRGLAVIRAFDAEHPEQTLSDVARATDLTRAAARRFLLTLVDLGYVRTDGRLFSLTPRVLELGYSYLSSMGLPEVAAPHLESLVSRVRESASVSVLDDSSGGHYDVVYVARVPTSRIMTVTITIGTRFPAYATSMGRVLLAALPAPELDAYLAQLRPEALTDRTLADPAALRAVLDGVRADGVCVVDQELEAGLRSIAVPVHDRS
ncbi:MAG: IclR family transcriptional regulator C-terminal domain-containing protein, partial [Pseudonocardia sediminis]